MRYREIVESAQAKLPATPENIARAKAFVFRKWKERAVERGQPEPSDLSLACKFTSMFAQKVFGGKIRGNYDHQYVVLNGQIIDLNIDAEDVKSLGTRAHHHDAGWFGCPDHRDSMASCRPRVDQWVEEFRSETRSTVVENARGAEVPGWISHLWQACENNQEGFYFEEGGCWGMALAIYDEFVSAGLNPQIVVTQHGVHAMVQVGDLYYDWKGENRPFPTRTISREEVVPLAIKHGFAVDEIEIDYEAAQERIRDAKELAGDVSPVVENARGAGKVTTGPELLKRYGGRVMSFEELPEEAKKSLHQYMMVDGDNDRYDRASYGYVEVPIEDLKRIVYDQVSRHYPDKSLDEFWADGPSLAYRYPYPRTSVWPILWDNEEGMSDGWHRLSRYVKLGVKTIPVVVLTGT